MKKFDRKLILPDGSELIRLIPIRLL